MKVRSVTTIELTEREAAWRTAEAKKARQQVADLMEARDMLAAQLEEAAARLAEVAQVQKEHEQVAADMFEWADQARADSGLPPREAPADADQKVATGDQATKAHPVAKAERREEIRCAAPGRTQGDQVECRNCGGELQNSMGTWTHIATEHEECNPPADDPDAEWAEWVGQRVTVWTDHSDAPVTGLVVSAKGGHLTIDDGRHSGAAIVPFADIAVLSVADAEPSAYPAEPALTAAVTREDVHEEAGQ